MTLKPTPPANVTPTGPMACIAILMAALLTLTACQPPRTNPSLEPLDPIKRWVDGKRQVEQVKDGLCATVAFQEARAGRLLFHLEVANQSGAPVLVAPEQVSLVLANGPSGAGAEISAVDPEVELQALARDTAQVEADKSTHNAFRGLFLLGNVADAAANTRYRTMKQNEEARRQSRENFRDLDRADQKCDTQLAGIASTRSFWEAECLRKTTVEPGQGVRGKVVFEVDSQAASTVLLRLRVEPACFEFTFQPDAPKA